MKLNQIKITDSDYPENLKHIFDPPQKFYIWGELKPDDKIAVAIVGSRKSSSYGVKTAERLGYELASRGITVVSGLARGIDTAGHKGAVKAGGRTIAVLGNGHNDIYPPENKSLAERITKNGAVISEYEPDTPPLPQNFPKRNRIISGLSLGIIVVEAARKSGALITARLAGEQGREVFAVPGSVDSETSRGTHDLIKDGARLVQTAEDVIEELNLTVIASPEGTKQSHEIASSACGLLAMTEQEKEIFNLISNEQRHIDQIIEQSNLSTQNVTVILTQLELKKLVKQLPGKYYVSN